jgi:hypothetical protein
MIRHRNTSALILVRADARSFELSSWDWFRTGTAGTQQMCDTMSLLELFPRHRREPPVSLGESRGLNKERP